MVNGYLVIGIISPSEFRGAFFEKEESKKIIAKKYDGLKPSDLVHYYLKVKVFS